MKRTAVLGIAVLVATFAASAALTGQGDPFLKQSDRGETVHVLPPPALVHFAHDPNPTFAPTTGNGGLSVYRASYGAGNLQYHRGLEIAGAKFIPIFWNGALATRGGSGITSLGWTSLQTEIDQFLFTFADGSNYEGVTTPDAKDDYTVIQQYGNSSAAPSGTNISPSIGYTTLGASDYVDSQAVQSTITDAAIQSYLSTVFNNSGSTHVTPSANAIYGVYFPPGMTVYLGSSASCSSFCGYHSVYTYNGIQIKYAVFPYPNCSGCHLSGLADADMWTIVTSHEIREAVTDPGDNGVNAWYDSAGYEADDKCAWHNLYQMSRSSSSLAFWVQPEYSNGGTVAASGFTQTYPRQPNGKGGCVVPK